MQTKLVLLGTGTPNACPNANGPSLSWSVTVLIW